MSHSESKTDRQGRYVQSLERAFDILEVMAKEGRPISISYLSEKVNLKVSTVHRLLATMVSRGFVRQNEEDNKYRLGLKLWEIGNAVLPPDVRFTAKPYLEELVSRCEETVNLAVLDGHEVVYIDQVEPERRIVVKMFAQAGSRGPAYATASGKVLLAYLPEEKQEEVINKVVFEKFTTDTITNAEDLKQELNRIRSEGYALDWGELEEHIRCAAVPVFNHEKKAVAAISVSGVAARMSNAYVHNHLLPDIKDVGQKISQQLGYVEG